MGTQLIDIGKISARPRIEKDAPLVFSTSLKPSLFDLSVNKKMIEKQLGTLETSQAKFFVSRAHWNLHEVVQHFASQLQKPDLYFTTWAMKEQPARAILDMKNRVLIGKVFALISDRMPGNDKQSLQLLEPILSGSRQLKLHAKVACLLSENEGITILGSANWSANPRIETGVAIRDFNLTKEFANWILNEIER